MASGAISAARRSKRACSPGGLCSVSGMLPDLDSDSGRPVQEMSSLRGGRHSAADAGAVQRLRLVARDDGPGRRGDLRARSASARRRSSNATPFTAACGTACRPAWPAGCWRLSSSSGPDLAIRLFKAGAVSLGFLSHLVLDEIWSFQLRSGRLNVKKSFGTALKFFGKDRWANAHDERLARAARASWPSATRC